MTDGQAGQNEKNEEDGRDEMSGMDEGVEEVVVGVCWAQTGILM